ncbi:Coenzyme F420 hydrogenase/dehydrogenase, beta subunit C-terminal domain [Methanonatronarchaeum sp. AMET-Sl]|uniref:Coenzyme F420 hydrogenase/dehydrogenase, beta subunit C-terminal domain n=1 Tax=Methanonatronarchaeum sp. AMET-Sl TaxID=3037654 RepID=UPI00244E1E44|nr:Coenzyme F420 hydrogenase/dehydrogenase, beta subunit C-terminal domain [Methanonatronarchaeum sp. AMET-Sl]WGI16851.1 Coenzyme F420 hydrogenase/dehydrogenase, beta subunit C-terminal domain [Methanonatronarchaeum sp. AMET-Sl]
MSFSWLRKEVVESGLCRICGACVAACKPGVIEVERGPELVGECIECGLCSDVCPAINNLKSLGVDEFDRKKGFVVRSQKMDVIERSQDGGAVTSILISLLNSGLVDSAVVVGQTSDWKPIPLVVTEPGEVLDSAGTKFGSAPILSKVSEASEHGDVAVVGTPCQIEAARLLDERGIGNIKYFIGVFCMKNFQHELLFDLITDKAECKACDIKKIGINKGKFNYKAGEQESALKLSEIDHCIRPVCRECTDFESRYADISVGSVGSPKGWSTVIIRSEKGEELFKASKKHLDIDELGSQEPVDRLCRIKQKTV